MAKKKKKVHHRRRHRIGARSGMGGLLMHVGGIAAGAVIGKVVSNFVKTKLTSVSPVITSVGTAAVGAFLPKFIGKGNPLIQGVGDGILAVGVLSLAQSQGWISGIGGMTLPQWRGMPKLQSSVGASRTNTPFGVMKNPISGVRDMKTVGKTNDLMKMGALYDN